MSKLTENEINNLLDAVADIPDTFSAKLIKHIKRVENTAHTLEGKIEKLESSYFGKEQTEASSLEKGKKGNLNSISHDTLNYIDEVLQKAMDFVAKL